MQEQQHAGWRNTYKEHVSHVRHRAHVPITDGLIEGPGSLQRSEGRAAVWSERRSRSEGTGDGRRASTTTQRRKSSDTRDGGARTENMLFIFVTELTSHLLMS
jgi:hypothetical protein